MRPQTESYVSRWASCALSVRSLTATTSTPSSASDCRRKERPMRPKPLMPMRVVMRAALLSFLVEHLRGEVRVRAGDAQLLGALVRCREEASDASRDGVLRHEGIGELPQLLERRLLVGQPERSGVAQMLRHLVAEDLQGALDSSTGGHGRAGGPTECRVFEVL